MRIFYIFSGYEEYSQNPSFVILDPVNIPITRAAESMSFLNILKEREKKKMLPMNEKKTRVSFVMGIFRTIEIPIKMYISWDGYLVFFENIIVSGERATRKKVYL